MIWFEYISNDTVLSRTGLTHLSGIQARHRYDIFALVMLPVWVIASCPTLLSTIKLICRWVIF